VFPAVLLQIQDKQPNKKLFVGLFDPEDEGTMMLQNAWNYLPNCTA